MISYVCKYTPTELFAGFGEEIEILDETPANFEISDKYAHANLCGFGKSVIQAALSGRAEELVLVNCCDTIRRVYDILKSSRKCRFLYLLDLPHTVDCCRKKNYAVSLLALKDVYQAYSNRNFDRDRFIEAFQNQNKIPSGSYIGILGARTGKSAESMIRDSLPLPVRNLSCVGYRYLSLAGDRLESISEKELFNIYADALLSQLPCRRMNETTDRRYLFNDPNLRGIVYHTIKFCDYYGFEYAEIKNDLSVPILKLETDCTKQSEEQLRTRLEAFAETFGTGANTEVKNSACTKNRYVAGIDSGSTSTDVVILDQDSNIVSSIIIPTGGGAQLSAEKCLAQALQGADIERSAISRIITTGYGRAYINDSDGNITEISCHAKGAYFLRPTVRTVIDIGGQDSKVIRLDENGAVKNFVMNDKCAAGTGRFLEMMARTLGLTLEEMSKQGLTWKKEVEISSMCTVFAESEVVSLIAQNRAVPDIIHGLNKSVADKVAALVNRLGLEGDFIITGGVSKNIGVVNAIEKILGIKLYVCDEAQICGALGAALFALE